MGWGPNIPECRGWGQRCGEYVNDLLELCDNCTLEKQIDEAWEEWQRMRDQWQERQSDGGRWDGR